MKLSECPTCSYINIKGVRCTRRCMKFESIESARCSEHRHAKNNTKCQFVFPDGRECPNYHHTTGIICSFHGTTARLEYLRISPGVIVKDIDINVPDTKEEAVVIQSSVSDLE
jgi:hypothetical protein